MINGVRHDCPRAVGGVGRKGPFSLQFIFKFSPFFYFTGVGWFVLFLSGMYLCVCACVCVQLPKSVQTFVICAWCSSSKGSFSGSESVVSEYR